MKYRIFLGVIILVNLVSAYASYIVKDTHMIVSILVSCFWIGHVIYLEWKHEKLRKGIKKVIDMIDKDVVTDDKIKKELQKYNETQQ